MVRTLLVALALIAVPLAGQEAPRIHELHEVDAPPAAVNAAEFTATLAALYPAVLRDSAIGGTAQISFVIGADGAVREAVVVDATRPEFGAAAVEAVGVLRFTPATVDGAAVGVRVTQPVEWRVDPDTRNASEAQPLPPEVLARVAADPMLAALVRGADEAARMSTEGPRMRNHAEFSRGILREYRRFFRGGRAGGAVTVRFIVDADGVPRLPYVIAADDAAMGEAALRIVRPLRFTPARANGAAVPVWLSLPITWAAGS